MIGLLMVQKLLIKQLALDTLVLQACVTSVIFSSFSPTIQLMQLHMEFNKTLIT